jgi:predicted P-loop ATPase/GTPase
MVDVEHYLNIYKGRKEMMEKDIINPLPESRRVINEIVEKLSKMPLSEKIILERKEGNMVMMESQNNTLVVFPNLSDNQKFN